jgi:hypothetical protein
MEGLPFLADLFFSSKFLFFHHEIFILIPFFSTQKILQHARMAEQGAMVRDPLRESIGLELDMINIL